MNLKFSLNVETLKALLPVLRKSQPYIYGLLLIGLFGFSAYEIDKAIKVQAAETQSEILPLPKITFDKKAIEVLKSLSAVGGEVPLGDLGANDPFN